MTARATFALSCAAFVLLALCATTAADEACSADDGPISCESCREGADVNVRARCAVEMWRGRVRSEDGFDSTTPVSKARGGRDEPHKPASLPYYALYRVCVGMNVCCDYADVWVPFAWLVVPSLQAVAGLPRVSQGGFVSSNLGYYDWFVCTDDGCTEWDGKDVESPKDERSPANYIQSVATYFGFAIAMAVLSFVCFCCCCLWRMCGCCGGWTPTYVLKRNGKRRSCGCGFHRNLNPLLLGGDKFTYPTTQVLLVRLLMIVFVILTLYVTRCPRTRTARAALVGQRLARGGSRTRLSRVPATLAACSSASGSRWATWA